MNPIVSPILIPTGSSAPTSPPSGYISIYCKSDNEVYIKLSDGTEKKIS